MTALAYRHETKQESGVWVRLRAYPVNVWVSDAEIDQSIRRSPTGLDRTRKMVALNIAIGKRCGSYREWPRDWTLERQPQAGEPK